MSFRRIGRPKITIQQEAEEAGPGGWRGYLFDYIIPGLLFFIVCSAIAEVLGWFR